MKQTIIKQYSSPAALVAAIAAESQKDAWKGSSYFENFDEHKARWAGETIEDANKKLAEGDAKLAAKIKAEGEILKSAQGGTQPRIEVSVVGCVPSVPNYLRGVPANMMRVVREPRRNPVINVYVENSIYDGINTNAVARKAAIIANVISATELAGVRVNLYSVNTAEDNNNGSQYACVVKIKDAQSPLNLLNIAFPLCNRAMHRNIFMRWLERHADNRIFGYGRPMRGYEAQKAFSLQGVVLSIRDLVDNDYDLGYVTKQINDYLSEQGRAK